MKGTSSPSSLPTLPNSPRLRAFAVQNPSAPGHKKAPAPNEPTPRKTPVIDLAARSYMLDHKLVG